MWVNYYNESRLELDVELTTHCNARCPQCSRTNEFNVSERKEWLPLNQVTIDDFKKWFPQIKIKHFHFSGKYGDPGMCKDLKLIVEYIINNSKTTTISINTNGSMRNEEFWFDLCGIGKQRLELIFDVDGINQEMHSFYRRGTSLDKVLKNIEAACQTISKVSVLTVMFKHNEDYIEDIQNMCRKYGVKHFDTVEGNNFLYGPTYKFIDEDGKEQKLEQITRKDREQGLERKDRRVRDHRHDTEYKKIVCAALKLRNLQVSSTGLVIPCCHLSTLEKTIWFKNHKHDDYITTYGNDNINPLMQEYIDRYYDFSLYHKNIDEIVNDEWYSKSIKNSWSSKDTASFACKKVCGIC